MEASAHSIPAAALDFALVPEVLNNGTRELHGRNVYVCSGHIFNIHHLVQHESQVSDCCSREFSYVESDSIFHGLIFMMNR